MKFIYTKPECIACIELKARLDNEGVEYEERDGDRLINPGENKDVIDIDGLTIFSIQNRTLPVVVEVG